MLKDIIDLINAFANLHITNQTILFAIVIVFGIIIIKIIDDRKFDKYYNDMVKQKDKEIIRLADDNKRYREVYLKNLGLPQLEIDNISAANVKGG